jgi:hypothetical protein
MLTYDLVRKTQVFSIGHDTQENLSLFLNVRTVRQVDLVESIYKLFMNSIVSYDSVRQQIYFFLRTCLFSVSSVSSCCYFRDKNQYLTRSLL